MVRESGPLGSVIEKAPCTVSSRPDARNGLVSDNLNVPYRSADCGHKIPERSSQLTRQVILSMGAHHKPLQVITHRYEQPCIAMFTYLYSDLYLTHLLAPRQRSKMHAGSLSRGLSITL